MYIYIYTHIHTYIHLYAFILKAIALYCHYNKLQLITYRL